MALRLRSMARLLSDPAAKKYNVLELAITDFCNLGCPLCSQATPLQKNKKIISIEELENISRFIKPFEFYVVKISGGEPTLHPHFREICQSLKKMFPAHYYILATNGFKLEALRDCLNVFNHIDLSHYPGLNDAVYRRIINLNIPNIRTQIRRDNIEMVNVHIEKNLNKHNIYKYCIFSKFLKIVQCRIYPCCVIFGLAVRKDIDINRVSVLFDADWRRNLAKINMQPYCEHCWVDIQAR